MEQTYYVRVWCHALAIDEKELVELTSLQLQQDAILLSEQSAQTVADALGISLEQLIRRPTPRDLRGEKMARLAKEAGQEAVRRK